MIKGVNRQVVEVNDTGCDYFERIMFFVKPEYAGISEGKIRERAGMIANGHTPPPPTKRKRNKIKTTAMLFLAALCGSGLTFLLLRIT